MFKLFVLTVLLAITAANAFYECCTDQPSAFCPRLVTSPFCSGALCTVVRGETLLADVHFTPVRAHARLDVTSAVNLDGSWINLPIPAPDDNACNSMFRGGALVGCPTVPNVEHMWRLNYQIPTNMPSFHDARVRFELKENGILEGCVDIQATIL